MPESWADKDERQYEHIKYHLTHSGKAEERSKEIAARTVNKQRRKEGRTLNKTTQGTGNPNYSLVKRTRRELYNRARQLRIEGRSSMNKEELITAIRAHN